MASSSRTKHSAHSAHTIEDLNRARNQHAVFDRNQDYIKNNLDEPIFDASITELYFQLNPKTTIDSFNLKKSNQFKQILVNYTHLSVNLLAQTFFTLFSMFDMDKITSFLLHTRENLTNDTTEEQNIIRLQSSTLFYYLISSAFELALSEWREFHITPLDWIMVCRDTHRNHHKWLCYLINTVSEAELVNCRTGRQCLDLFLNSAYEINALKNFSLRDITEENIVKIFNSGVLRSPILSPFLTFQHIDTKLAKRKHTKSTNESKDIILSRLEAIGDDNIMDNDENDGNINSDSENDVAETQHGKCRKEINKIIIDHDDHSINDDDSIDENVQRSIEETNEDDDPFDEKNQEDLPPSHIEQHKFDSGEKANDADANFKPDKVFREYEQSKNKQCKSLLDLFRHIINIRSKTNSSLEFFSHLRYMEYNLTKQITSGMFNKSSKKSKKFYNITPYIYYAPNYTLPRFINNYEIPISRFHMLRYICHEEEFDKINTDIGCSWYEIPAMCFDDRTADNDACYRTTEQLPPPSNHQLEEIQVELPKETALSLKKKRKQMGRETTVKNAGTSASKRKFNPKIFISKSKSVASAPSTYDFAKMCKINKNQLEQSIITYVSDHVWPTFGECSTTRSMFYFISFEKLMKMSANCKQIRSMTALHECIGFILAENRMDEFRQETKQFFSLITHPNVIHINVNVYKREISLTRFRQVESTESSVCDIEYFEMQGWLIYLDGCKNIIIVSSIEHMMNLLHAQYNKQNSHSGRYNAVIPFSEYSNLAKPSYKTEPPSFYLLDEQCAVHHREQNGKSCIWKLIYEESRLLFNHSIRIQTNDQKYEMPSPFNLIIGSLQNVVFREIIKTTFLHNGQTAVRQYRKALLKFRNCVNSNDDWLYLLEFQDGCKAYIGNCKIGLQKNLGVLCFKNCLSVRLPDLGCVIARNPYIDIDLTSATVKQFLQNCRIIFLYKSKELSCKILGIDSNAVHFTEDANLLEIVNEIDRNYFPSYHFLHVCSYWLFLCSKFIRFTCPLLIIEEYFSLLPRTEYFKRISLSIENEQNFNKFSYRDIDYFMNNIKNSVDENLNFIRKFNSMLSPNLNQNVEYIFTEIDSYVFSHIGHEKLNKHELEKILNNQLVVLDTDQTDTMLTMVTRKRLLKRLVGTCEFKKNKLTNLLNEQKIFQNI